MLPEGAAAQDAVLVQSDHVAFELYTMSKPTIFPLASWHGNVSARTATDPIGDHVTESGLDVHGFVAGDDSLWVSVRLETPQAARPEPLRPDVPARTPAALVH